MTYSIDNYDSVLNRSQEVYDSEHFDDQFVYTVEVQSQQKNDIKMPSKKILRRRVSRL